MASYQLDDVDKRLLGLLQENARYTAIELAEKVGVSDNTIHNRMERLEEEGIVSGYAAAVNHDQAGLGLYFLFICTARISERSTTAEKVLTFPQVVEVTEVMSGERNLLIKMLGAEDEDITRVAEKIDDLDIEINDEKLIRTEHIQPLDYVEIEELLPQED